MLAVIAIFMTTACQKNVDDIRLPDEVFMAKSEQSQKRAWKDAFNNSYFFVPDFAGGWAPPNPAPAWYPGSGTGNATHMGNATTFYNQKAIFGPSGLASIPQPVTMFYAAELSAANILNVPDNVSSIVLDSRGNSVWFESEGSTTTPVSPTRIEFTAVQKIVGGTGRFVGATGETILTGFFNPTDQQDAGSQNEGWIRY